jgi:hypothetical protein
MTTAKAAAPNAQRWQLFSYKEDDGHIVLQIAAMTERIARSWPLGENQQWV